MPMGHCTRGEVRYNEHKEGDDGDIDTGTRSTRETTYAHVHVCDSTVGEAQVVLRAAFFLSRMRTAPANHTLYG